ncbi:MAG TPA: hypothetical protein PLF32_09535 [Bacteroidales bacterium]|nr:hypothetical protein [Bacteroidales bacterium]HOR82880.1 hypothetical protein [Bacteroidales bacterium]HPJ91820.1 hypothetical protein [Bacteroidales bacterium]
MKRYNIVAILLVMALGIGVFWACQKENTENNNTTLYNGSLF